MNTRGGGKFSIFSHIRYSGKNSYICDSICTNTLLGLGCPRSVKGLLWETFYILGIWLNILNPLISWLSVKNFDWNVSKARLTLSGSITCLAIGYAIKSASCNPLIFSCLATNLSLGLNVFICCEVNENIPESEIML